MTEIPPDHTASHSIIVTGDMTVDFEQSEAGLGKLHQVYATYWLGKHFELVSRKLTLPFLEYHEEGIGFELFVRHLAPTLPGMRVELEARFLRSEANRVHCVCRAHHELGVLIGEGSTTQVIMQRDELQRRFDHLERRRHRHGAGEQG